MTTPSDPVAIQPPTYETMAKRAQDALDEQNKAVEECRTGVKHGHAVTIPHDTGSEYEAENEAESSSEADLDE